MPPRTPQIPEDFREVDARACQNGRRRLTIRQAQAIEILRDQRGEP
jgi:hypothetical protein